eukprot:5965862-Amphidinium_carterae.2
MVSRFPEHEGYGGCVWSDWSRLELLWHSAMAVLHTVVFNLDDTNVRGLIVYNSVHGVVLWKTALEALGTQRWFYLLASQSQPNYVLTHVLDPSRWKACDVEGVPPSLVRALSQSHLTVPHLQVLWREREISKVGMPTKEYDVVAALVKHILSDVDIASRAWMCLWPFHLGQC